MMPRRCRRYDVALFAAYAARDVWRQRDDAHYRRDDTRSCQITMLMERRAVRWLRRTCAQRRGARVVTCCAIFTPHC